MKDFRIVISLNPTEFYRFLKYIKIRNDEKKHFEPENPIVTLPSIIRIDFDTLMEDQNGDNFPVSAIFNLLKDLNDCLPSLPDLESFNGQKLEDEDDLFNFFPKSNELEMPYCDFDELELPTEDNNSNQLYQFTNIESLVIYKKENDGAEPSFPLKLISAVMPKLTTLSLPYFSKVLPCDKSDLPSYEEKLNQYPSIESVNIILYHDLDDYSSSLFALALYSTKFTNLAKVVLESSLDMKPELFQMIAGEFLENIKKHKREGSLLKLSTLSEINYGENKPFCEIAIPDYEQPKNKRDNTDISKDKDDNNRDSKRRKN